MITRILRNAAHGIATIPRFGDEALWVDARLLDELDHHGLSALVYPFVKDAGTIPELPRARLRHAYESALVYRDLALQLLRELANDLTGSGRVVLMQGLALIERCYPEPWARPMSDIDLYLPDGNLGVVQSVLRKNGFNPFGSYERVWLRKGLTIDLHLDFWGADRIPGRKGLFRNATVECTPSMLVPGYHVPDVTNAALQSAFHGIKHAFAKKKWLFDLLMLKQAGCDIALLGKKDSRIGQAACWALYEAELIDKSDLPEKRAALPPLRRALMTFCVTRGSTPGCGELAVALLFRRWWSGVRYLLGSMFPPTRVLREMYGSHPLPNLIARRLFSLLGKNAP
jgi:hypothetical protein